MLNEYIIDEMACKNKNGLGIHLLPCGSEPCQSGCTFQSVLYHHCRKKKRVYSPKLVLSGIQLAEQKCLKHNYTTVLLNP